MSTFRAFQTGLMAGQQQAKTRREDDARTKAAEAFSAGNYEGASQSLMGVGLMQDADAYRQAGEHKRKSEARKSLADTLNQTGMGGSPAAISDSLWQAGAQQGDPDMMLMAIDFASKATAEQAQQFTQGMEFLAKTAYGLKNVAPELRGEEAIKALQNSPYANEQVMAQIQRAAADGRIDEYEIDRFIGMTISVAELVKAQMEANKPFTLSPGQKRFGPDGKEVASVAPKPVVPKASSQGLNPNQLFQGQLKLDDLDRELEAAEKSRKTALTTVSESLGLIDDFIDPANQNRFNEVYGNWINPDGDSKGWDQVAPGSPRANGIAILEQIGGRAFLDSIQAMKGSGSLSDREGAKVAAAATRLMNMRMSDDEALKAATAFRESLTRYKNLLEQDIETNRRNEASRRKRIEGMMVAPSQLAEPAQAEDLSSYSLEELQQMLAEAEQ